MPTVTATTLACFEGVEEPVVRFIRATGHFDPDTFENIKDLGGGRFRMTLRHHAGEWWDGDRDTDHTDRQRAEVKGLGGHQQLDEVFEYGTTWQSNRDLQTGSGFCHIFQLKATDDCGPPLVTISLLRGTGHAALKYTPAGGTLTIAKRFAWHLATEQTLRIRIKPSATCAGEVQVKVGDDPPLTVVSGLDLHRPGHSVYRPKWGFYRAITDDLPSGEDFIEHSNVSATKL